MVARLRHHPTTALIAVDAGARLPSALRRLWEQVWRGAEACLLAQGWGHRRARRRGCTSAGKPGQAGRGRLLGGALPGGAGVGHKRRSPCVEFLHRCTAHLARIPTTATTGMKGTSTMAPTDYDAPRRTESDDVAEDSLDALKERRNDAAAAVIDVEETDTAESFELPGADLSGEELSVRVVPKQADEFTCSTCFLVHHRYRYAGERAGLPICRDCAA